MPSTDDVNPAPVHRLVGHAVDLIVLEEYERDFFELDGGWRDDRIAKRLNKHIKQVYLILEKPRFHKWIHYGVSLRSGWLTDEGKNRLRELRELLPNAKITGPGEANAKH